MARRKSAFSKKDAVEIFRGLVILAFLAYGSVIAWWNSLPQQVRSTLIVLFTLFFGLSLALIVLLIAYFREKQA